MNRSAILILTVILSATLVNCGGENPDTSTQKSSSTPVVPFSPAPNPTPAPTPAPAPAPAPDPSPNPNPATVDVQTQNIFRSYSAATNDHLFSLVQSEGPAAGYADEGVGFALFANASSTRTLLYRCYVNATGDHFISNNSACEGKSFEGPLGYAEAQSAGTFTHALYRCYHTQAGRHLITLLQTECTNNGFAVESILGYL